MTARRSRPQPSDSRPPRPGERQAAGRGREGDGALLAALRRGEEAAFVELVRSHSETMLRVAMTHVRSRALAEEVVQDTWLAFFEGLHRFKGEASIRTWLFSILLNIARRRGRRERRSIPLSSVERPARRDLLRRLRGRGVSSRYSATAPPRPDAAYLIAERHQEILSVLDRLPRRQRLVVLLRDHQGWTAAEVCALLDISGPNQRVLLHRGRRRLRRILGPYAEGERG